MCVLDRHAGSCTTIGCVQYFTHHNFFQCMLRAFKKSVHRIHICIRLRSCMLDKIKMGSPERSKSSSSASIRQEPSSCCSANSSANALFSLTDTSHAPTSSTVNSSKFFDVIAVARVGKNSSPCPCCKSNLLTKKRFAPQG